MDKRIWINVGLLVFIVVLFVVVFVPEKNTEQDLPLLTNIDSNDIVKIEVIRKNLDDFIFNKQGDDWYMSSPLQLLANNARINAMLRLLSARSYAHLNPAEVELARFELTDPVIAIKFNDYIFQLGNTDAIDQRRYVLFNNMINLVDDSLYQQLTTNAAFFADPKILPVNFDISAIDFPENRLELVDDQWQMHSLMDIHPDQLKRIIFNWNNASAISVAKYAAPEIAASIIVSSARGDNITFEIVSTEPYLILGRKDLGIQYHLGSDEGENLLLPKTPDTNTLSDKPGEE